MSRVLVSLVGAALASTALGNVAFSVTSQSGGAIPSTGTGGGLWPTYGTGEGVVTSDVFVTGGAVKGITSVTIHNLAHTWIGDLQITLRSPSGTEHTLMHRPGSVGGSIGNAGDFDGGDYTFVESGGAEIPTIGGAPASTYNQYFVGWFSGNGNTFNTPMTTIAGAAGTWTLVIRDWGAGDSGSFTGWTLNGLLPTPGASALFWLAGFMTLRRRR